MTDSSARADKEFIAWLLPHYEEFVDEVAAFLANPIPSLTRQTYNEDVYDEAWSTLISDRRLRPGSLEETLLLRIMVRVADKTSIRTMIGYKIPLGIPMDSMNLNKSYKALNTSESRILPANIHTVPEEWRRAMPRYANRRVYSPAILLLENIHHGDSSTDESEMAYDDGSFDPMNIPFTT